MNIFVLNTGRCGSMTFIKACQHITNFTAMHKSRSNLIGAQRLAYANHHIEADNRLCWMLGRLDERYGDNALYVHLQRDHFNTANSFAKCSDSGIMRAYKEGILSGGNENQSPNDIARDYIQTINSNIDLFLKDKTNTIKFQLENAKEDFKIFWEKIGAEGDIEAALNEWDTSDNAAE